MKYGEIWAKRIRELCKRRKITINRLANMSGIKQSTIDNIMRGLTDNPTSKTLQKLAHGLSMRYSELTDYAELDAYTFEDEKDD